MGTIFDPETKAYSTESVDDNFDLVIASAGKMYILRPVLRPSTVEPLLSEMKKWCVGILDDVMNAFTVDPPNEEFTEESMTQKDSDSVALPRLKKFTQSPNTQEGNNTERENDASSVADSTASPTPGKKIVLHDKQKSSEGYRGALQILTKSRKPGGQEMR